MTEEQEINNIAEIIWKHLFASCEYDWQSSNDNEYYPVEWAATDIYKLINPDNTKVKLIINKNNIKPNFISPLEQEQGHIINELQRKLEFYMHRVKLLEKHIKNSEEQEEIRNKSFISKLFDCFKNINYITVSQNGLNLYKEEPKCINAWIVSKEPDDEIHLGYNFAMKNFPIKKCKKFKDCGNDCYYKNQRDCGVRLYFRGDFL